MERTVSDFRAGWRDSPEPTRILMISCAVMLLGVILALAVPILGGLIMLIAAGLLGVTAMKDVAAAIRFKGDARVIKFGAIGVAVIWAIAGLAVLFSG